MSEVSDNDSSVYKPLTILLFLGIVGVIALYTWYADQLKLQISQKGDEIDTRELSLSQANEKIGLLNQAEQDLRAGIVDLKSRHQTAAGELQRQIDAEKQNIQGLMADMEALRQSHSESLAAERSKAADALAAEQQKAADAHAEVSGRLDEAKGTIDGLNRDIATLKDERAQDTAHYEQLLAELKQDVAEARTAHDVAVKSAKKEFDSKTEALEKSLTERIAFFQTALEGDDPERAAQLFELEQNYQANRTALAERQQQFVELQAAKDQLDEQHSAARQLLEEEQQNYTNKIAELEDVHWQLSQLHAAKDQLAEQHSQTQRLLEEERQNHAGKVAELEDMQQQLQDAQTASAELNAEFMAAKQQSAEALDAAHQRLTAAIAEHEQQLQAAIAEREKQQDAATALLQRTRDEAAATLSQAQAEHDSAIGDANGRIDSLNDELSKEQATLAALKQEYETVKNDLNTKLTASETSLSGVRSELAAVIASAESTKLALEGKIATAESRIVGLEEDLVRERELAAQELKASEVAGQQAVMQVRNMFDAFDEMGARRTEQGMLVDLDRKEVYFHLGQATLKSDEQPSLDRLAAFLNSYPSLSARVEGHTDSTGRDETNLKLSQERAETVMNALVHRGVDAGRLIAEGIGEARPIADNETKYGRFRNRRVEIYISGH